LNDTCVSIYFINHSILNKQDIKIYKIMSKFGKYGE